MSDKINKEALAAHRKKVRDDWFTIRALLKIDMKSRFGYGTRIGAGNVGKWIFNFIMSGLMYAIIVFLILLFTQMFVARPGLRDSYIVIVSMASIILQFFICTATLIKALYYSGDNEILLRFPVNGTQIFIAKSIFVFISNFLITMGILLPFYICYGVILQKAGALGRPPEIFYPVAILTTFLSSFLPFFLANIVAIPVMKLINIIKNKYGIVLCVTILVVVGIFVAYMQLLKSLVGFYIEKDMALFSPEVMGRIGKFAANAFPFNLYANMLLGHHPYINLIYVLLLTTGVGLIAMLIVKKWYFSTILDGIENQRASFTKRTSDKPIPPFLSYMRRDFYGILRSFNYSFQYLVMAAAAPVMVYYCNALAGSVGSNSVGNNILPGISLMVITIFVTVIVSFSSTAISREGGCFYHTKIIPLPYWKQVLAKFLLYSGVATLSIILCCIAVSGAKFVSPVDAVMIFFIAEFSNIALTSLCMWFDTKSPTFNFMGDGELVSANKNVAIALALGLVFAVLYGLFTMIGGFLPTFAGIPIKHGAKSIMGLLLIVSGVAAALGIVLLFVKLNKRYNKLYQ